MMPGNAWFISVQCVRIVSMFFRLNRPSPIAGTTGGTNSIAQYNGVAPRYPARLTGWEPPIESGHVLMSTSVDPSMAVVTNLNHGTAEHQHRGPYATLFCE